MNRYTGINRDATLEGKRYIQNRYEEKANKNIHQIKLMTSNDTDNLIKIWK